MTTRIIRTLFFVACIVMGGLWANYIITQINDAALSQKTTQWVKDPDAREGEFPLRREDLPVPPTLEWYWILLGCVGGGVVAMAIMWSLQFITPEVFERIFPALVSIVMGMAMGWLLAIYILYWWPTDDEFIKVFLQTTLVLVFGFIGVSIGLSRVSGWESLMMAIHRKQFAGIPKIVDTSVIIDGRIAEVCRTGFLEGTLIVPRFILKELHTIADSSDPMRRARGRRGLDILKELQQPDSAVRVEVVEDDPPRVKDVDGKILVLAREYRAKVLTNDVNLNKVAQIEGIEVLNLNDLANAVKTSVLPDEQIQIKIVREGKEPQQGVGYLDDGTMIVVDGGKDHVGKTVTATVTSVLQTSNGRMIFTKLLRVYDEAV